MLNFKDEKLYIIALKVLVVKIWQKNFKRAVIGVNGQV